MPGSGSQQPMARVHRPHDAQHFVFGVIVVVHGLDMTLPDRPPARIHAFSDCCHQVRFSETVACTGTGAFPWSSLRAAWFPASACFGHNAWLSCQTVDFISVPDRLQGRPDKLPEPCISLGKRREGTDPGGGPKNRTTPTTPKPPRACAPPKNFPNETRA